MNKTAIILGATGLTGGLLLDNLLEDDCYDTIKVFGRSSCNKTHPKLKEYLGDLFVLNKFAKHFTGDVVFCCIGTTKAKTPNKETYKKIDYGIPVAAAILAKENSIATFIVISAMGANPNSKTSYNKLKGMMERDVLAVGNTNTYIFRPSLIGGHRKEKRTGERIAQYGMRIFGFLVPKAYKMISPETIAQAMQTVAANGYKESVLLSNNISELAPTHNARNRT